MGESIAIGVVGAAVGVGLGFAGSALIDRLAPPLSATVVTGSPVTVSGSGRALSADTGIKALTSSPHTISVTLSAPVTADLIGLAVALAIAGGLIAGMVGGWRAARLRCPSDRSRRCGPARSGSSSRPST